MISLARRSVLKDRARKLICSLRCFSSELRCSLPYRVPVAIHSRRWVVYTMTLCWYSVMAFTVAISMCGHRNLLMVSIRSRRILVLDGSSNDLIVMERLWYPSPQISLSMFSSCDIESLSQHFTKFHSRASITL